ncbi:hypothetical protein H5A20_06985 [Pectobacterium brasiliense]|uniref:hypothetical protein n=1 Tax=Pectobacterium TaxID=122277 RepID=UPI001969658B|nr:hypothetical protein [Pectobacterium brasiliense]MBN3198455.1 hypothetical protein [Pectobacterium brasiliense]
MTDFFSSKNVKEKIEVYIRFLSSLSTWSEFQENRNNHCINILKSMLNHPLEWSNHTNFNTKLIGLRFISKLSEMNEIDDESIDDVFSDLFRFMMELYFNQSDELNLEMIAFKNFALEQKKSFTKKSQGQIDYALNEMPFSLFRDKYHRGDIQHFIKAAEVERSMEDKLAEWDKKTTLQLDRVEALNAKLYEQETAYNFVGLYHGYDSLSKTKKSELKRAFVFTLLLGVLVLLPFSTDVFLVYKGIIKVDSIISFLNLLPAFTLTFIFIYYFRILLSNYTSIKAQVNQIELRKTLCTFIQKYSEYAKEMKSNDSNSLEKFEAIIFSNIMPSEDKIPSTFDGIEQIAKLIESVKGK